MSGLEPAIITAALSGISAIQSAKQARAQSNAASVQARYQLESMEKQRQIKERDEKGMLRRKLASQRAKFGSSGLVASNSADAVLDGFRLESEQRLADGRWFHNRNVQGVNQDLATVQSQNPDSVSSAVLDGLKRIYG